MKHLAAYVLLTLGGNTNPSAKDIEKVLSSVGIEADSDRLDALLTSVGGKDINELINEGASKLSSVPSGGGAAISSSAAGSGAAAAAEEEKVEEKVEEKEESDEDMGFGLFD